MPGFWKFILPAIFLSLLLSKEGYAIDVTLQWNANSEPDLSGYMVYYDTNSGRPYEGTGSIDGDSPIDVGNVTSFTVTGLDDSQTYYFAVTAYDTEGLKSAYSNEVSTNSDDSGGGPSVSGGGGGGGGGCFIATAIFDSNTERHVHPIVFLLVFLPLLITVSFTLKRTYQSRLHKRSIQN